MIKNATKNETITTTEISTVTKNIILNGVTSITADKITTTYRVVKSYDSYTKSFKIIKKKLIDESSEKCVFYLDEVSSEDLAKYRQNNISSFVLKVDGILYYSEIPDNICFTSSTILGLHLCAFYNHECKRLSAASDVDGGCQKVRELSKCIERYPWITDGYETFGTKTDSFVVAKCLHYESCLPSINKRKKVK